MSSLVQEEKSLYESFKKAVLNIAVETVPIRTIGKL